MNQLSCSPGSVSQAASHCQAPTPAQQSYSVRLQWATKEKITQSKIQAYEKQRGVGEIEPEQGVSQGDRPKINRHFNLQGKKGRKMNECSQRRQSGSTLILKQESGNRHLGAVHLYKPY